MDILTIIASAIGGIFIWNLLFSSKKKTNVCEAAPPPGRWQVKAALERSFGTTNIPAALEIAKSFPDPAPGRCQVEAALERSFGTTNLDYVFENYMSQETRKKVEQQLMR